MLKDGICRVREGFYTKTIAYEDINYSVASSEDQSAIFDGWCGFLNYFDSALLYQPPLQGRQPVQGQYPHGPRRL